jgi:putative transcriptional regulator
MILKVNLEHALAKRNMSTSELSDRIGISESNLQLLGKIMLRDPRFKLVEKICNELHLTPDEILNFEKEKVYSYQIR